MTLDDAIEQVLRDAGRPLHVADVAAEIGRRGLYERGDEGPLPTNQIHARISKHPDRFAVADGVVRLLHA
ncbi:winged helix-turn-helix domain-containing protein [Baekduia sp. Peel2402]|uniref:winged helix-turn-helix domain-containing protein n=1 Tax=Baekduia sp. Peel2402 TaxID=3458296 RepID=UPI00403E7EE4